MPLHNLSKKLYASALIVVSYLEKTKEFIKDESLIQGKLEQWQPLCDIVPITHCIICASDLTISYSPSSLMSELPVPYLYFLLSGASNLILITLL